jgi:hypothetical protein
MERRSRLWHADEDRRFQTHDLVGEVIAPQIPCHLREQRIQQIAKAVMMAFEPLQENLVGSCRKLIKGFTQLERRLGHRIEHHSGRRRASGNEIVSRVSGICLTERPQRLILAQSDTAQIMAEAEPCAIVFSANAVSSNRATPVLRGPTPRSPIWPDCAAGQRLCP